MPGVESIALRGRLSCPGLSHTRPRPAGPRHWARGPRSYPGEQGALVHISAEPPLPGLILPEGNPKAEVCMISVAFLLDLLEPDPWARDSCLQEEAPGLPAETRVACIRHVPVAMERSVLLWGLAWEADSGAVGLGCPHHPAGPSPMVTSLTSPRNQLPAGPASPAAASPGTGRSRAPRACLTAPGQQPLPAAPQGRQVEGGSRSLPHCAGHGVCLQWCCAASVGSWKARLSGVSPLLPQFSGDK